MDSEKNDKVKGFAGFNSMVSDIDKILEEIEKRAPPPPPAKPEHEWPLPVPSIQRAEPSAQQPQAKVYSAPTKRPWKVSGKNWGWGIAIIVIMSILLDNNKKNHSVPASDSQYSYTPPNPTYTPPTPSYTPPPVQTPSSKWSVSVDEEIPPVGNGLTFEAAQIRYCLSEKIRINGMERILNHYSKTSVASFNSYVDDYNARCSSFRYRSGLLEEIRREVNSRRKTLESLGVKRALENP